MRLFGELLSSELGGAVQPIHQGRRVSGWCLEIAEFAKKSNVLAQQSKSDRGRCVIRLTRLS
jgi:hypothetical protein